MPGIAIPKDHIFESVASLSINTQKSLDRRKGEYTLHVP
jgi:hypothetical protein